MMFADRDYERKPILQLSADSPIVTVQNWTERGYSVVNVQCKDRTKLLFDVVCTLTDMEYIVFHATVNTTGDEAYLEFYIRHMDGTPISSEPERQRVVQCLQASVERRASKGVRLELCAADRVGLLAEVTRTFRGKRPQRHEGGNIHYDGHGAQHLLRDRRTGKPRGSEYHRSSEAPNRVGQFASQGTAITTRWEGGAGRGSSWGSWGCSVIARKPGEKESVPFGFDQVIVLKGGWNKA
ncbi:AT-hook motif nuclear-localized protein [Psidium guajava]|nr:AT-hook motif nuclear-localized protein [Psidium guajava]